MAKVDTRVIADELHIDQHTARRFLRTVLPQKAPGRGGRWALERRQLATLKSKYERMHGNS